MFKTLLFFGFILIVITTKGQRVCATDEMTQQLLINNPELSGKIGYSITSPYLREKLDKLSGTIYIPVAFHVVYHTRAQNIPDSVLDAQLWQTNEDLAGRNPEVSVLPRWFRPLVADCNIVLYKSRVIRTYTDATIFYCNKRDSINPANDPIKFSRYKGASGLASTQYLNIWTGPISDGQGTGTLHGYSSYPGGIGSLDGIVLNYKSVGSTKTYKKESPYSRGRTLTHEFGHWLNLLHLWGKTTCGTDSVADTPPQMTENRGIPTFPILPRCDPSNLDTASSEMFMNFMDYSNDSVIVMFTQGQKDRMRSQFLEGGRRSTFLQFSLLNPVAAVDSSARLDTETPVLTNVLNLPGKQKQLLTGKRITWTTSNNAEYYVIQARVAGTENWETNESKTTELSLPGLQDGKIYEIIINAKLKDGETTTNSVPYLFQFASSKTAAVNMR